MRLQSLLRKCRRGVVYLPLSQNSGGFLRDSLIIWLATMSGWRVAVHLRGSEFQSHFYETQRPVVRWWVRKTLVRVDSVAVLGESLRRVFDGLVPVERIAVVPNGSPAPTYSNGSRDHNRVLFLSNIRRRKGVVEALDAAMKVSRKHPAARFTFAGDTDEPTLLSELRARAATTGGAIEFVPAAQGVEKDKLLARSGILLFPPRLPEGHPRVVLEAMSAGMAIVTTAQGAIPETVRDGVDGFVLPTCDPDELASRLSALLSDFELQARMGAAARQRYEDRYTLEAADRRLVEWLKGVNAA